MHFPNRATICYLINDKDEILLQHKSRGFGQGKWNGPGGKIELGETPEQAVKREVWEETGLKVLSLEHQGELEFIFPHKREDDFYCYVFISREYKGEPEDKGEGELKWFSKERIPLRQMWDDDKYWLQEALGGEFVRKRFYFNKNGNVDSYFDLSGNDKNKKPFKQ
jgi:8-oxo-dGTP diphosphatase